MSKSNSSGYPDITDCLDVRWKPGEIAAIKKMAQEDEMSERNVILAGLRLRQLVRVKQREGLNLAWTNDKGELVREPVFGCGPVDD